MSKAKKSAAPEPFGSLFELINNDKALCKRTNDFPISCYEITMPNGSVWVFTYGNCSCDISLSSEGAPPAFRLVGRYDVLIELNNVIDRQCKRRRVGAYDPEAIAVSEERKKIHADIERERQAERKRMQDLCTAQLQKDVDESRVKKRK